MDITYLSKTFPTYDRFTGKRVGDKSFRKVECVKIRVDGDLFQLCKEIDQRGDMSYRGGRRTTSYKRGFFRENGLVGFLGEAAASLLFDVEADWSYKCRGDEGYDFILGGKRVDVKTARSAKNQRNYIIRVQYYGSEEHRRELKSDLYIGSYVEDERTFERGWCDVILVGYISKGELDKQPLRRSPVQTSNHLNTEMFFSNLAPIRGLLKYHEHYTKLQRELENPPRVYETETVSQERVWCFVSPEGEKVSTTNLAQFCREKSLQPSHMTKVFRGKRPHHKGWKACI